MLLNMFNTFASLLMAAVCGWAIMSTRVRDGIVVKTGLGFLALGFFGAAATGLSRDPLQALVFARVLVHIGLLICVVGYLMRTRRKKTEQRRVSDWANLTRTPQ